VSTAAAGEITGLDQSIAYAEHLAGEAGQHGADGGEAYLAHLAASRVTGAGLTTGHSMQDAFATAAVAAAAHATELTRQKNVQEQYDVNPDVGDKTYLTSADDAPAAADAEQEVPMPDPSPSRSGPDAIRITTDETEQFDLVVTPNAATVRIDLAAALEDSDDHEGRYVILDAEGVAALVDAGAAMDAAEKAGRAAYKKLDAKIGRLEQRRDRLQNQPFDAEGMAALRDEHEQLTHRGDQLRARMRGQLNLLNADDRAAFNDLESQLFAGGDRQAIRAAQRRVMTAAGAGQQDQFFTDQAEADKIAEGKAELRRRAEAIPMVSLSTQEQAELDRIPGEIKAAETAILDMTDDKELAAGVISTQDGSGLAWRTTMHDDGRVAHQLRQRPIGGGDQEHDDDEAPRLTGKQLRQVIKAATGPASARSTLGEPHGGDR
jgi:hypothetical protein